MLDFKIPILMYHEVTTEKKLDQLRKRIKYSYIVSVQQFESQMRWLADEGFSTVSLYDVVDFIEKKRLVVFPKKPIIITFDDGFIGNIHYGLSILKKYGFSAIFFITVNQVGKPFMMNWIQLKELDAEGMLIQSHSMTHPLLGQLNRDRIAYELNESKQIIQSKLQTQVDFLSLPGGSYNDYYRDIAFHSGYRGGCTSEIGFVNPTSDPFLLNRIVVDSKYGLKDFKFIAEMRTDFTKKIIFKRWYKDIILKILGEKFYNQLFRYIYRTNS